MLLPVMIRFPELIELLQHDGQQVIQSEITNAQHVVYFTQYAA